MLVNTFLDNETSGGSGEFAGSGDFGSGSGGDFIDPN